MKLAAQAASIVLSLLATSALAAPVPLSDAQLSGVVAGEDFTIVNEVSDQAAVGATTTDPMLVNAWGLSQGPGTPLWVANNGTGTSTIYSTTTFAKSPLTVAIPAADGSQGAPTGTVFTSFAGPSFSVTKNGVTGHSLFLFDSEDGTITGWSPSVDLHNAVTAVDQSSMGAVFKGLAIVHGDRPMLYAADFTNGQVKAFDSQFNPTGMFTDTSLPSGFSPFNVQVLNGKLYVAFALHGSGHDEVHGPGLGAIDVFDTSGHKIQTLVSGGPLNAPWGMVLAPSSFGKFAGALLVGNFGDGKINAFNPKTGAFLGTLDMSGSPLSIDGLWALHEGSNGSVIFSAGPDGESHGLVGVITPTWAKASWAFQSHTVVGH